MKSITFLFGALFAIGQAAATPITIVSQTGNNTASYPLGYYAPYGSTNNPGVGAVSWTQTDTFTNVTISANIWQVNGYTPGTTHAYLVSAIGNGTTFGTTGVAQATITSLPINPSLLPVLTVSTLGPGTYYLVIDSDAVNSSWTYGYQAPSTVTTAAGVTFGGNFGARGSSVNTSYSPGSSFFQFSSGIVPFSFSVTTDTPSTDSTNTPEPATFALTALALLAATCVRRS